MDKKTRFGHKKYIIQIIYTNKSSLDLLSRSRGVRTLVIYIFSFFFFKLLETIYIYDRIFFLTVKTTFSDILS